MLDFSKNEFFRPVLVSLALISIPYWFTEGTVVNAGPTHECNALETTAPGMVWVAAAGTDGAPVEIGKNMVFVSSAAPAGAATGAGGYLGVAIGEVPEALEAQLETEGAGILILEILKDGPAEKAGLTPHDVILSIDGVTVDGDVARATELIRSRKPGDRVVLQIVHDGQRKSLPVVLGTRPESDVEWKFMRNAPVEETIRKRHKIALKGPDGKWLVKDLGGSEQSTEVHVDGSQKVVKVQVNDEGTKLIITQEDGGEIVVRRIEKDGTETTATYENEEELKAGDSDAHELFAGKGDGAVMHFGAHGVGKHGNVLVELEQIPGVTGEWRVQLEEQLEEAQEAFRNAREELDEAYREMADQFRTFNVQVPDGRSEPRMKVFSHAGPGLMMGKPVHTFNVQSDGKIEVRSRMGDSEMVRTFKNEADLAAREPKLFEKYQRMMESEE